MAIQWLSIVCLVLLYSIYAISNRLRNDAPRNYAVYHDISADDGDWRSRRPVKIRNFKDVYHLTMALQSSTINDLILMDETYEAKIKLRRQLIKHNFDDVIGSNPVANDAVVELYRWLFTEYLPRRFPDTFQVVPGKRGRAGDGVVHNLATSEAISLCFSDAKRCLMTIGRHIDCEFAILLPTIDGQRRPFRAEPSSASDVLYYLHAFVLTFPSGFNTARKLGMSLAEIHGPVPGYSTKLEKSMNRFFASLPFGKVVQRSNWAISTDDVLFKPGNMHIDIRPRLERDLVDTSASAAKNPPVVKMAPATYDPSEEDVRKWQKASQLIDPKKCSLRIERQTLHRLEQTGALVFGFKTILEPLDAIKQEGLGPQLARALEGMRLGSVPAMDVYKDGVIWRKPLVQYLNKNA